MRRVGVLAVQGDYAAHCAALESAGAETFEVRTVADIEAADGIVLPGGESTTIGSLLVRFGLMRPLVERIRGGMPAFGTCAGLILLAKRVEGREQAGIRLLDATVRRNAYGRQVDSFRATVRSSVPRAESIEAVFIRAPRILDTGSGVEILARLGDEPVLIRQGSILGCCFHPELVEGASIHKYFLTF
jgi:5'-phosphate synthase pdxT subunit